MTELEAFSQMSCRAIEETVNTNLQTVDRKFGEIATLFVENGYCLRRQLNEKMYEAAGYETFEDYIKSVYGRSRSWAKRMMQINEKFSIDGNHPRIDERYIGYSVSQLQEMLYLTDEQIQNVSPDMTVKEIREVRKSEEKITPIQRGCITGANPNGTCACCGNEGTVECCAQCAENCNVRCGWIKEKETKTRENCLFDNNRPCTIDGAKEAAEGMDINCMFDCCSRCNNDDCGARCNTSVIWRNKCATSHAEETRDKAWFVKKFMDDIDGRTHNIILKICRNNDNDSDRAKKIQEYIAPHEYKHFQINGSIYEFHGFQNGMDFTAENNKHKIHIKYGRLVKELFGLYSSLVESEKKKQAALEENQECNDPAIVSDQEEIPGQMHVEDYPELLPEEPNKAQEIIEITEVQQATNTNEVILEGEYKEVPEEKYEETTENTDMELLKEMLDKEKYMLDALLKEYTEQDIRVRKAKIKVSALASMLFELELTEEDELEEIEDAEQPALPILKNNDQRKAFLESYQTWPVWFSVPEGSETYYRYNLPDGSSLVICEYKYYLEWKIKYHEGDPETKGTREYLLKPGYHYLHDCRANTSMLVEHLKNVLKGEK